MAANSFRSYGGGAHAQPDGDGDSVEGICCTVAKTSGNIWVWSPVGKKSVALRDAFWDFWGSSRDDGCCQCIPVIRAHMLLANITQSNR